VLPHLVVLDGYALNPGDLSWDPLAALATCRIHDRTSADDVVARLSDAALALTNKVPLGAAQFDACPKLRYVGVLATGYNIIDVAAAAARGIVVTNVPDYGSASVAQHTFALLLELTQHAGHHAAAVAAGRWSRNPDWCFWDHPLHELDGRTLGLVGYGRIARGVARIARGFGMTVVAHTRTPPTAPDDLVSAFLPLDDLLARSDVVSLHCPLTTATERLINAERLARMKSTAILLNTSRGPLIDESALAAALAAGHLAGVGLDVLSVEPPPPDHPLLLAPRCLITPHQAWATHAARSRLLTIAVENVRRFLAGDPVNVVS
jgi:glycerate dehydrogenase